MNTPAVAHLPTHASSRSIQPIHKAGRRMPGSPLVEPEFPRWAGAGNLALARALGGDGVRTKHRVSQPGDSEETEADHVADEVTSGEHSGCHCGGNCASCQGAAAVRRSAGPQPPRSLTHVDEGIQRSLGPGNPLDPRVRADMETRFGAGFDGVRIHTGREATAASRSLGARAFTVGHSIAFDEGEFAPDTAQGSRLLAHELTHLDRHAGMSDRTVYRQPADAGVPDAGPVDAGGGVPTTVFRGVTVSSDPTYTYGLLERMYIAQGYGAVEDFVTGFEHEVVVPRRPIAGVSDDPTFYRDADIGSALRTQFERIRDEERAFVEGFENHARAVGLKVLEESLKHVEAEAIRYGVANLHPELSWTGLKQKGDVADNASTRGISIAAQGLLDRKTKAEQAMDRYMDFTSGVPAIAELASQRYHSQESQFTTMQAEIKRTQREFDVYRIQVQAKFPLIAALANDETFKRDALEDLAKGAKGKDGEAAQVIIDQVTEKRDNIAKVSGELKPGGDVNIWRVSKLVDATRHELAAPSGTLRGRFVDDKIKDEEPGVLTGILIGLLQLGLVLLAPVTGGLSLIPAAIIGVGTAYSHYKEYQMKLALHGTDFGAAALSAEEPSLFWLAVDIVAAGFDVAAAAGPALRIFRTLAPAAKGIREGEATAEAIAKLERQAAELGGEKLAKEVGRDARAMGGASRDVGITAEEARKFEQAAADIAARELPAGVASAETLAGGSVKVSRSGSIWSCNSPCGMMRERYKDLLARKPEYAQKLDALEAEARKLAPDSDVARRELAGRAAALEREMRTTSLPGDWNSPLSEFAGFDNLIKRRGSVAAQLDHHPPGWTGREEARFRFGEAAESDTLAKDYRWVLDENGLLSFDRMNMSVPPLRFNPATLEFEEAFGVGLKSATRGPETVRGLDTLPRKDTDVMQAAFKNRRDLIAKRDKLEALEETGKIKPQEAADLRKLHAEINEQSRRIGEQAAEGVMSGRGGKKIYPVGKTHSTSGDFDQVWKVGDEFHIVEAKGGSSGLGSRSISEAMRAEQGTVEYAMSIAENMARNGTTKEIRQLGDQLVKAIGQRKIKYVLVRAPIVTEAGVAGLGKVKVSEFVLPAATKP